jgi:phosphoribosylformylglycinamidine (FGAM) synthase-like enzyme
VRAEINASRVAACHDISDGGLLVAVAEMAMAGDRGVTLDSLPNDIAILFGEDQARYLIETASPDAVLAAAKDAGIYAQRIGAICGAALTLPGGGAISVRELKAANEAWLPAYMAGA